MPYFIGGQVTGHAGLPVAGARVIARSTPFSTTTGIAGFYRLGVYPQGNYHVTARKAGYGKLPPKRIGVTKGLKYFFVLPPKVDAVVNGGFEGGFNSWRAGSGIYRKTFRHSGEWGAYLSPPGRLSQAIPLIPQPKEMVLSFVYRVPPASTEGSLRVFVQGKGLRRSYTLALAPDDTWRHGSFLLPAHRGPLKLTFWVRGEAPIVWLDEVSLGPTRARSGPL